ncbi:hypothetical protein NKL07_21900 [Mesorhizobium sp. C280B]|uniref:hypothetical protein n=1 Tax=unclassified Mesorhizobium TaxID=325217 RepID=UPI0003CED9C8|nr:hypothetical protein [Mesorhizobium sp. LSJC280B00]ESW92933.1 hypothetical protein X772_02985 [Mesorhizobium sp. LSJC280B00]
MRALLLSAFVAGALVSGLQAGRIYDAAFVYSESCDRAPLPNAFGRYQAKGLVCHLADYIVYGASLQQPVTACTLARAVPTDANIEACTGQPI